MERQEPRRPMTREEAKALRERQQLLKEKGVAGTLEEVSGLSADDPAVAMIAAEYARLKAKY